MKFRMGKRWIFLLGAAGSLALSGCSGGGTDAVTRIQESGSFRVAVGALEDTAQADEEQTKEMALMETIGAELGVPVEFLPAESGQAALTLVTEGSADAAIGAVTEALAGENKLSASISYGEDKLYVATRRGDYSDSPAVFSGRNIGILLAVSGMTDSITSGDETIQTVDFTNAEAGGSALLSNTIDGLVCSYSEGISMLNTHEGQLQLQNLRNTEPQEYVIAVSGGENRLLSGINTIISRQLDEDSGAQTE